MTFTASDRRRAEIRRARRLHDIGTLAGLLIMCALVAVIAFTVGTLYAPWAVCMGEL